MSSLLLVPLVAAATLVTVGAPATAHPAKPFPARIALPNGFTPEGLTIGRGTTVYVGSILDGAVWRGDLRTGRGSVLIPGTPGTDKAGLKLDPQGRLWTADFSGGGASVYDAGTGAKLAHYQFTDEPGSYVNDLVITDRAVYFTDSGRQVLYVVPLGPGGRLPAPTAFRVLQLTGPAATPDVYHNGIVALPDGDLLVAQMLSGQLVRVDPRTGGSRVVDLGGYSVERADGLVLRGRTLYVIRNLTNVIAVVRMNAGYTAGVVQREITGSQLRSPATGDLLGSALYVVNGRFDVESTPSTDYDIVRVPA
ncbi:MULTISPECIES: SMP-30/gluconolactonase/LRE family protein [unclassified Micromonospora]|uniref:SMP-30/gluconolactonase/LRE family protein n=1 Tax=Micromonospora TaxID=1873 RepID=UPI001B39AC49|nr:MULTISPECIES: superoxide dismutase [unclassified Micromonospora]MBQ0981199.1 superoxide dismutase [Micromonospora sp. M61]MBQ1035593.1 superoxide dismutase [Micromonospora sp. C81]